MWSNRLDLKHSVRLLLNCVPTLLTKPRDISTGGTTLRDDLEALDMFSKLFEHGAPRFELFSKTIADEVAQFKN